jgi:hypothetical protein
LANSLKAIKQSLAKAKLCLNANCAANQISIDHQLDLTMTNKTIKIDFKQTIITQATTLADRHALYVDQFVTRANDELYAILAEVMALYEQVQASPDQAKLIKHIRQHLRDVHSIKTQANTKTTALIAKLVTRASRKTAHVYSRVLEVAIAAGVNSADLVDFIKLKGGIDKVRLAVCNAALTKQQQAQAKALQLALKQQLENKSKIGAVTFQTSTTLPHACDVEFTHVLCQFNTKTGQHEIISIMYPSSTLETMAMDQYLLMLSVATTSDHDQNFYALCKENGLNMDLMHRWMRVNEIASAGHARLELQQLKSTLPREADQRKAA